MAIILMFIIYLPLHETAWCDKNDYLTKQKNIMPLPNLNRHRPNEWLL